MTARYVVPSAWIRYQIAGVADALIAAKAAVRALTLMPFQRAWAASLQELELKREVAGTSRIEGAEFTEREFEEALAGVTPAHDLTRSQRQARSAAGAYRWIATVPPDRPVDAGLIKEIHRRIVTGCDDDHAPPGELRGHDQVVSFGQPRRLGALGGRECQVAFDGLCAAIGAEFRGHDPLIRALAAHYHIGAMHPFPDGNGRTARALEALLLQRAGLSDVLFVAMSNYYYEEKAAYLAALTAAGEHAHDLTEFLAFGLRGVARQCERLLREIRRQLSISLYRDMMQRLYGRLLSTRKRALATRQQALLHRLLEAERPLNLLELRNLAEREYSMLKAPDHAFARDVLDLIDLGAVKRGERGFVCDLDWPITVTETEFYARLTQLPKARSARLPEAE